MKQTAIALARRAAGAAPLPPRPAAAGTLLHQAVAAVATGTPSRAPRLRYLQRTGEGSAPAAPLALARAAIAVAGPL